jgi:hypothetical protein
MKWNEFFKKTRFVKLAYATLPILVVIVVGSALLQISEANGQAGVQSAPCTLATLSGSYGFQQFGWRPTGGTRPYTSFGPGAAVGLLTFDGAGKVSGSHYLNIYLGRTKVNGYEGTYRVNPNCTGSLEFGTSRAYFVIVQGGNEFFSIPTSAPAFEIFTAKKQ